MIKKILTYVVTSLIIMLIVAFVREGFCGKDEYKIPEGPQAVAETAVLSLQSMDVDTVCKFFVGSAYSQMRAGLADFFPRYDTVEIRNLDVFIDKESDTIATARIYYELYVRSGQYEDVSRIERKCQLIYQEGQWYLNGKI